MVSKIRSFIKCARLMNQYQNLDNYIQETSGLIPIDNTHPDDIFIVGYPKSGNTWMQHLLSCIVHGLNLEYIPYSVLYMLVPDVHQHCYYRRYMEPMYFKSHKLPRPHYHRVIYLLRDGRDVMVSYLHHLQALERHGEIDFGEMVRTGRYFDSCKWHEHVSAWQANPYNAEMMTVKYEDLQSAPVQQLLRVCEFLSLSRPISLIESAVEMSSFPRMRAKEERLDRGFYPGNVKGKFFVRRGVVEAIKMKCQQPVVDLFLEEAAETLRTCGYL